MKLNKIIIILLFSLIINLFLIKNSYALYEFTRHNIVWSGNPSISTISKLNGSVNISNATSFELAQYRILPTSVSTTPRISISVDLKGNVWAGSSNSSVVVKIGLLEENNCVDKNSNGVIETSRDVNKDGLIQQAEIYPFGEDECVLFYLNLSSYGVNSIGCIAVDNLNNAYVLANNKIFYINKNGTILSIYDISISDFNPTECIFDRYKNLWINSNNNLYFFDTNTSEISLIGQNIYTFCIDFDNDYLYYTSSIYLRRVNIFSKMNTIVLDNENLVYSTHCKVDNNFIYIYLTRIISFYGYDYYYFLKVNKYNFSIQYISLPHHSYGMGFIFNGNLWVNSYYYSFLLNTTSNQVVFISQNYGSNLHSSYGDITGYIIINTTRGMPICGNGVCDIGETYLNCKEDCPKPPQPPPQPPSNETFIGQICSIGSYFTGSNQEGGCLFLSYIILGIIFSLVGLLIHTSKIEYDIEVENKHIISISISLIFIIVFTYIGMIDLFTSIILTFLILGISIYIIRSSD